MVRLSIMFMFIELPELDPPPYEEELDPLPYEGDDA